MHVAIEVAETERTVVVDGIGDIGAASVLRLGILEALEHPGTRVVVDLIQVPFVDSTVLGVLIGGMRRAQAEGSQFVLRGLRPQVRRLLETTGMQRVFSIED